MSRVRSIGGAIVGVILPPMAAMSAAAGSAYLSSQKWWLGVALMSGAAAVIPPVLKGAGTVVSGPSTRDKALGTVLTMLVKEMLNRGSAPDPSTPAVRATAFVPGRRGKEHVLVPHLRVTSRDPEVIERCGKEFQSKAHFRKGESFVGQVWEASTRQVYKPCNAEVDFADGGLSDKERVEKWAKQFDPGITERWSDHMRKVRTVWVFAIPKTDGNGEGSAAAPPKAPKVVAVISVDSTQSDAFAAPSVDSAARIKMNARQATETAVVGMFHSLANRRKRLRGV